MGMNNEQQVREACKHCKGTGMVADYIENSDNQMQAIAVECYKCSATGRAYQAGYKAGHRAALASAPEAGKWLPIESASKEHLKFVLLMTEADTYLYDGAKVPNVYIGSWDKESESWCAWYDCCQYLEPIEPIHWQPLPTPPRDGE